MDSDDRRDALALLGLTGRAALVGYRSGTMPKLRPRPQARQPLHS